MDPNYVDSNAVVSYEYKKCDDDDSTYKPISSDKLLAELNSLKPGTYYIRGVVSETNHYLRLTTKSLKFTVLKAEPTPPSIVKYTWEYGEQPELVPESMLDNCQYSYKYYYRDTNVKVNKEYPDVGKYYLSIYNSGSDLYKSGSSPQKFITITQRTATLSWKLDGTNTFKIPYDGKPHVPTATVTNTVGDDKCKVTVSGEQTEVGTYTATATELSDSNYKLPVQNTVTFEIVKAHREAPTSVTATGTTYKGGTDGKLNNVDSSMEYRKDGENEWRSITGDTVEGLSTGKYYVRYKDSNNYYASSEKEVYGWLRWRQQHIFLSENPNLMNSIYPIGGYRHIHQSSKKTTLLPFPSVHPINTDKGKRRCSVPRELHLPGRIPDSPVVLSILWTCSTSPAQKKNPIT